jgi:hypothetical protein
MTETILSEPTVPLAPTATSGIGSSSEGDTVGALSSQPNGAAIEALLTWQSPTKSAEPGFGDSVPFDNLFSAANGASMLEAAVDTSPMADESNDVIHAAHSATNLLDSLWGEGADLLSAVATETLFALWSR